MLRRLHRQNAEKARAAKAAKARAKAAQARVRQQAASGVPTLPSPMAPGPWPTADHARAAHVLLTSKVRSSLSEIARQTKVPRTWRQRFLTVAAATASVMQDECFTHLLRQVEWETGQGNLHPV